MRRRVGRGRLECLGKAREGCCLNWHALFGMVKEPSNTEAAARGPAQS